MQEGLERGGRGKEVGREGQREWMLLIEWGHRSPIVQMIRGLVLAVLIQTLSSLVTFSSQHLQCLNDRTKDCYFMIFSYPLSRYSQGTTTLLNELSTLYGNSFEITQINDGHPNFKEVLSVMNLPGDEVTLSYYISYFEPLKVRYHDQFDMQSLTTFAGDMINERIRTLRSEDVPQDQQQVLKLVGVTFNQYISETPTETIVLFYHHQQLRSTFFLPKFQRLGLRFKNNQNIKFATFNVATNQLVQASSFQHLPAILYFHNGSIEPVFYEGPNQISKLHKWMRETTDLEWVEPEEESGEEGIEERR